MVLIRDPNVKSAKDVTTLIERRLRHWANGELDVLVEQSKRCAKGRTVTSTNRQGNKKRFANQVQRGDVTRVITARDEGTVLKADDITDCKGKKITVLEQLKEKHPVASRVQRGTVDTTSAYPAVEDIVITSAQIEKTARKLRGSAGPSGADSYHWKSVLLRFGSRSEMLRDCIATLACKMNNEVLPWKNTKRSCHAG